MKLEVQGLGGTYPLEEISAGTSKDIGIPLLSFDYAGITVGAQAQVRF